MPRPFFDSALLVEDEIQLSVSLKVALRKLGIPARHVSTLKEAKREAFSQPPEFILLDRTLPDGDGLELCDQLRKQGYAGSILILTASGNMEDRVKGLNSGADDYLPKPFSWEELEARIRALSRRKMLGAKSQSPRGPLTESLLWVLDEAQLRILGPKGWIQLTPLEFKLAGHLIQNEGSIVSRNKLLKEVWGFTLLPKTRTVDHFLGRLRKYFESVPEEPLHFVTIRGAGYRFQR